MARKPGETTAEVRARKERNAKTAKFAPGAAPVKALDKPSNNPPPSPPSSSSSNSNSSSSNAQSFADGKVNETIKNMNSGNSSAPSVDYSDQYDTSSPNFHTSYKSYLGDYDPSEHGGEAFGDLDYKYLQSQGHSDNVINAYLGELGRSDSTKVSNQYKTRAGLTANENNFGEKLSSEGLYQDKYSVGYHNESDKGSDYVSTAALGNMRNYFFGGVRSDMSKPYDFEQGYANWAGKKGDGGYAGDILKWYDSGKSGMTLNNEQYNRMVNDAKNFDWDEKMKSDGTQAGKSHKDFDANGMYDARIGGSMASQGNNNMNLSNQTWDHTNENYNSDASVDARNTRKQSAGMSNYESYSGNSTSNPNTIGGNFGSDKSDFEVPDSNSGIDYDNWQEQIAKTSQNPYSKKSNASNMNFSFNPYKFQQGQ